MRTRAWLVIFTLAYAAFVLSACGGGKEISENQTNQLIIEDSAQQGDAELVTGPEPLAVAQQAKDEIHVKEDDLSFEPVFEIREDYTPTPPGFGFEPVQIYQASWGE